MKHKLLDLLGYILFILYFIMMLPIMVLSGAIVRPIRYYLYVKAKVHDKKVKEYYF